MKRGAIVLTQELLKDVLKDRIPIDFKLSGVEYTPAYNAVKLHGYSEKFHETAENCIHLTEPISEPACHLIQISDNIQLITAFDNKTRQLKIEVVDTTFSKNCGNFHYLRITMVLPNEVTT